MDRQSQWLETCRNLIVDRTTKPLNKNVMQARLHSAFQAKRRRPVRSGPHPERLLPDSLKDHATNTRPDPAIRTRLAARSFYTNSQIAARRRHNAIAHTTVTRRTVQFARNCLTYLEIDHVNLGFGQRRRRRPLGHITSESTPQTKHNQLKCGDLNRLPNPALPFPSPPPLPFRLPPTLPNFRCSRSARRFARRSSRPLRPPPPASGAEVGCRPSGGHWVWCGGGDQCFRRRGFVKRVRCSGIYKCVWRGFLKRVRCSGTYKCVWRSSLHKRIRFGGASSGGHSLDRPDA